MQAIQESKRRHTGLTVLRRLAKIQTGYAIEVSNYLLLLSMSYGNYAAPSLKATWSSAYNNSGKRNNLISYYMLYFI